MLSPTLTFCSGAVPTRCAQSRLPCGLYGRRALSGWVGTMMMRSTTPTSSSGTARLPCPSAKHEQMGLAEEMGRNATAALRPKSSAVRWGRQQREVWEERGLMRLPHDQDHSRSRPRAAAPPSYEPTRAGRTAMLQKAMLQTAMLQTLTPPKLTPPPIRIRRIRIACWDDSSLVTRETSSSDYSQPSQHISAGAAPALLMRPMY